MRSKPRTYDGWGVELVHTDGDATLPGVGYSPHLTGQPGDFRFVIRTLIFPTRREAREALARYRLNSAWAFKGQNRIYRAGRVVPLRITVAVARAA